MGKSHISEKNQRGKLHKTDEQTETPMLNYNISQFTPTYSYNFSSPSIITIAHLP